MFLYFESNNAETGKIVSEWKVLEWNENQPQDSISKNFVL